MNMLLVIISLQVIRDGVPHLVSPVPLRAGTAATVVMWRSSRRQDTTFGAAWPPTSLWCTHFFVFFHRGAFLLVACSDPGLHLRKMTY